MYQVISCSVYLYKEFWVSKIDIEIQIMQELSDRYTRKPIESKIKNS